MKKLLKVVLVAGCMLFTGNMIANAQSKIGHVNFNAIIDQMPDTKVISAQLQAYQKTFIDQLTVMQSELQVKANAYDTQKATMTDAVRQLKEGELQDIQKRMQDYQTTAGQKVDAKKEELGKPLFDKVRLAISAVAKEKGYGYVIDSSQNELLVAPDGDDLMAAVKLKLGLK
ncbi:periplasmic chaperone for outer membrane proteins Skp [Mucilaginibacter gracilis]|uniref:Periplasmic chaperone for outer membrane proteins Skp n=1 Tax=Mucilaginibacter gracilis TaxID=423350 RepID=A0A495J3H3_9SPHI|nr:OmpH family outer membrane protein [Mucilaginibacter gracilis]RKR82559.1 periplasmic chaperone for outer membrane proteins Skp [Mucilaginibacter gracilis]